MASVLIFLLWYCACFLVYWTYSCCKIICIKAKVFATRLCDFCSSIIFLRTNMTCQYLLELVYIVEHKLKITAMLPHIFVCCANHFCVNVLYQCTIHSHKFTLPVNLFFFSFPWSMTSISSNCFCHL